MSSFEMPPVAAESNAVEGEKNEIEVKMDDLLIALGIYETPELRKLRLAPASKENAVIYLEALHARFNADSPGEDEEAQRNRTARLFGIGLARVRRQYQQGDLELALGTLQDAIEDASHYGNELSDALVAAAEIEFLLEQQILSK